MNLKRYAKCKGAADGKGHVLLDPIHVPRPERANPQTQSRGWLPAARGKLGTAAPLTGMGFYQGWCGHPETRRKRRLHKISKCCRWIVHFKTVDSCYVNFTSRRKKKKAREEKACVTAMQEDVRELCGLPPLGGFSKESTGHLPLCFLVISPSPSPLRNVFNKDHQYNTRKLYSVYTITYNGKNQKKNIYMYNWIILLQTWN